jgi:hypothetical protein
MRAKLVKAMKKKDYVSAKGDNVGRERCGESCRKRKKRKIWVSLRDRFGGKGEDEETQRTSEGERGRERVAMNR